jgi:hypothetical protein
VRSTIFAKVPLLLQYQLQERPSVNLAENWMIFVLLACLAILAWVRVNYPNRLKKLYNNLTNTRMLRQVMREEIVFSHRASLALLLVFLLEGALLIYLIDKISLYHPMPYEGWVLYLYYLFLMVCIYTIKTLSIRLVMILTDGSFGLEEYNYNVFLFLKATALVGLPILVCMIYLPREYAEIFLYSFITVAALFYVIRIGRGMINAFRVRISLFYIILYLCTLEILPLYVFFKVLTS